MTVTPDPAAPPLTRRERLRAALINDIKDCALQQLDEGGAASVSLRGIAREIGVSPAALYGYFDSLDALYTALMIDGYGDLARAVSDAVGAPDSGTLRERMIGGIYGFRNWAIAQPARFRLLYLSLVPGHKHETDGPVLTSSLSVFVPLLGLLVDAWESGAVPPPPPGPPVDASKFGERFGLAITSDQLRLATECWAEFHGLVALEVNGHISPLWVDPEALYTANIEAMMDRMGFTAR
jgi:AcrR family transcriptional regulator